MIASLWLVLANLASPFKSKVQLAAENMALRHQVFVLRRQVRGWIRLTNLDHLIVLGDAQLCQILRSCAEYYNKIRTHRSLGKDVPSYRTVQRIGNVVSQPIRGRLHHHYVRI